MNGKKHSSGDQILMNGKKHSSGDQIVMNGKKSIHQLMTSDEREIKQGKEELSSGYDMLKATSIFSPHCIL